MDGRSVGGRSRGPPSIERSLTSGGGWHFSLGVRELFFGGITNGWFWLAEGGGNVGPSDDRYIR